MTTINFAQFKTAADVLAKGAQLENQFAKNIGEYGREAARRAIEERKNDAELKGMNVASKYNAIKALYVNSVKGAPSLARAFNDSLIALLNADTPVTIERVKPATKTKKAQKVEVQTTAGDIVKSGTKRELREAAKEAMAAAGLGRKSSTRAPRAGGTSAKAPEAKTEAPSKPVALTADQLHAPILSSVNTRFESEDSVFIDKLAELAKRHGYILTKQ